MTNPRTIDLNWDALRSISGDGPTHPVFPTRRSCLAEMRPGEKLLVVRKWGGLGDVLITTMLFRDLLEQRPDLHVGYAVPEIYHPLFDGFSHPRFRLLDHQEIYGARYEFATGKVYVGPESLYHTAGVHKAILEEYDLIEDISVPCRNWEGLMIQTGAVLGGRGMRWRNRLERWANWIGFDVANPRTVVSLRPEEIKAAEMSHFPAGDKARRVVWSPISAGEDRSYPWFNEVKNELEDRGCLVRYLHHSVLGLDTIRARTFREMGAVVAAADVVLSVDTATFHWGGILGKPTVGLFNVLNGESHAKFYPTARTLQLCTTPCVAARYYKARKTDPDCEKWSGDRIPQGLSRCFHKNSVGQAADAVMETLDGEA